MMLVYWKSPFLSLLLPVILLLCGCSAETATDFDGDGSTDAEDCDPADPLIYPAAPEDCDSVDSDCDGSLVDEFADLDSDLVPDCIDEDADGDGYTAAVDCDDLDALINPLASEICDGVDSNCDDEIPEGELDPDVDGYLECQGDCDPSNSAVFPGAEESCDLIDSNCDEDLVDQFEDLDFDGIPDCVDEIIGAPGDGDGDGYADEVDCAPQDPAVFPGAPEDCDSVDQDCDGDLVDGFSDLDTDGTPDCVDLDADGDGVAALEDCDDLDALNYPAGLEVCDGQDNDCDSTTWAAGGELNNDGDGFLSCADCDDADSNSTAIADDEDCDSVTTSADCDDADPSLGALASDLDCDGVVNCLDSTSAQGIGFAGVCAGSFEMGCTAGQPAQGECSVGNLSQPVTTVTLAQDFWLSVTEVTQARWFALMGTEPSGSGPNGAWPLCGPDCPVEMVNWFEALMFTNALSVVDGLPECYSLGGCAGPIGDGAGYCGTETAYGTPPQDCASVTVNTASGSVYDCEGYRLPTEAEWERAARAGGDWPYSGGTDPAVFGWYVQNSGGTPHEVGTLAANAWGLSDLSGNVREWVWDWWLDWYYLSGPFTNPEGPGSGTRRGLRGGAFGSVDYELAVSFRGGHVPGARCYDTGFRVARTIP